MPSLRRLAPLLVCLALAPPFWGCGDGKERPNAQHLVLVTLDTLRRDHLGIYGYQGPISPNLDRLAERGVRFDDAFSL